MSKSKLIIILSIVFIVVAAGIGAVVYFTSFTPEAKSRTTAEKFMSTVLANNQASAKKFATIKDEKLSDFFEATSLRGYKTTATKQDGNTFYFSYQFTDDRYPSKARLGVTDQKVTALKYGDNIGFLPKSDKPENITDAEEFAGACLTAEDLAFIDSENLYAHTFRAMTMIFRDNTLNYAGKENGEKILDRLASFYEKSGDKDFKIELRGYASDDPVQYVEQSKLAQNRASKMREALIEKGVARDRVFISEPSVYKTDGTPNASAEYIDINIVNLCR